MSVLRPTSDILPQKLLLLVSASVFTIGHALTLQMVLVALVLPSRT